MSEQLTAELIKIFRATTILSTTTFGFAGQTAAALDSSTQQMQGFSLPQNPLVAQLQLYLYQHCYVRRFTGDLQPEQPVTIQPDNLVQSLSEANTSHELWDSGWRIHRVLPSGQILAHKHGLIRLLWGGEFINNEGPGMSPREGANITIFVPRESKSLQPGFYFAFGEAVTDQQDDYNVLRFYWHVDGANVAKLIGLISQSLNRFRIPYRLKCPNNLALYQRIDATVLYVNRRFYRISAELLMDVHSKIQDGLKSETPLFTKRIAPGFALAEDPGNGESFGMHRCRIVAEAIWQAYSEGSQTEEARLEEVRKRFMSYGLTLDRPYLNSRSDDQYDLPAWKS
jgi:type III HopA1-like effector protein